MRFLIPALLSAFIIGATILLSCNYSPGHSANGQSAAPSTVGGVAPYCGADVYNCSDFVYQEDAQALYEYCLQQTGRAAGMSTTSMATAMALPVIAFPIAPDRP